MIHPEEIHPYNLKQSIPPGTCLLIVGTAPPPRFSLPRPEGWEPPLASDTDFFYGSGYNPLWWRIFPQIYGAAALSLTKDRDASEARASVMRRFLADHGMWMRDVLQTFHREVPDSAKDSDLRPHTFTDFRDVFERCPTIDTVVFTGQKAEEWTYRAMREQGLIPEGLIKRRSGENIPRSRRISVSIPSGAREIDFHTLPSPSDGNFFIYTDEEKQDWYGKVLLQRCPRRD